MAVGFEQIAEADPARVRTVLAGAPRRHVPRRAGGGIARATGGRRGAGRRGGSGCLVSREMAAKRAEKEAKAKEGARG
ncbi:MAG: hypothetical protein ACLUE1_01065 [Adlercreutzia equolifaciens]